MKKYFLFFFILTVALATSAQTKDKDSSKPKLINKQIVELSCGECQFKMNGDGCNLAVRIAGKSYFVTGKHIDDFGDAHGTDGFCNAIRKAEVSGRIIDNVFKADSIRLLPAKPRK